jgi:HEPN domain-containing protein
MQNPDLVNDHLRRSGARLKAIAVLFDEESWADVVRESQEVVELSLKALLRAARIEVPRLHDVSPVLREQEHRLPSEAREAMDFLTGVSRSLRRDRELAFYGSEDLVPSQFYTRDDATQALHDATTVHAIVVASCAVPPRTTG